MPKGRGGKEWSSFSLELRLVPYFIYVIYGGGSRPHPTWVQRGGRLSHGLGGSVSVQALKPPKKVVGYRYYTKFLKERPTTSSLARGTFGNFVSTLLKGQLNGDGCAWLFIWGFRGSLILYWWGLLEEGHGTFE